ncbi:MAG: nitronate monooxygenase [Chloroflexi bacterium]|nr:nitronate monooxygenase [Chloroflexota bacterium]MBU1746936.1 nitronate monooxygenase [Chloroflexota bacterium]
MIEPVELLAEHKHGLRLLSPVMAAAGTGVRPADAAGLGAVVVGTLTRRPHPPAPLPRLAESPAGLVHRLHVGTASLTQALRRHDWATSAVPVIVSIAGTPADCAHLARHLDETPGIAGIELRLWDRDADEALIVVSAAREASTLPLLAKLSPAEPDLLALAQDCVDAGADVLVIGGPLPAEVPALAGWLSGPALLPLVVPRVRQVAQAVDAPVIGCGGVCVPADVRAYLDAGAQAVQVGSAFLIHPFVQEIFATYNYPNPLKEDDQ